MDILTASVRLESICNTGLVKRCYNCGSFPSLSKNGDRVIIECPNCKWDEVIETVPGSREDHEVSRLLVLEWNRSN